MLLNKQKVPEFWKIENKGKKCSISWIFSIQVLFLGHCLNVGQLVILTNTFIQKIRFSLCHIFRWHCNGFDLKWMYKGRNRAETGYKARNVNVNSERDDFSKILMEFYFFYGSVRLFFSLHSKAMCLISSNGNR